MTQKKLINSLGKRILSEANDLKRTISTLSEEIGFSNDKMVQIINGDCEIEESYEAIRKMGEVYAIDISDLYLIESDCKNGIKIMRAKESSSTSRIYKRIDKNKKYTPYYEYRDTAMSNLGPFKPEWIKELRNVDNSDPYNPDVVYNNGHFMHQTTLFIGPVNFYWEVDGKKFCREMNTGDSNYITPFWPHSFTNRDPNQEAYILAITFGGDVRRAQKELYALGENSKKYIIDYRNDNNKAIKQLIKQHMMNENMTLDNINDLAQRKSIEIDFIKLINGNEKIPIEDLIKVTRLLNIEIDDLFVPVYRPEDEVVVKHSKQKNKYNYPNKDNAAYRIDCLARTSKMPLLKGFVLEVLTDLPEKNMMTSLHTYVYNFGNSDVVMIWEYEGVSYEETIRKHDSLYMQPFVNHGFSSVGDVGKLYVVRVSGSINLATQKELSYMAHVERVFSETECWFD